MRARLFSQSLAARRTTSGFHLSVGIAAQVRKPVFLHQRDAHGDFAAILRGFPGRLKGGVAHCFTGGEAELDDYLALGLHIGVTGWACDERRGLELRNSVPRIPLDRLMIETDAPYLLPRDLKPPPKSRRNEPCYLPHIAATVARLRGESPREPSPPPPRATRSRCSPLQIGKQVRAGPQLLGQPVPAVLILLG